MKETYPARQWLMRASKTITLGLIFLNVIACSNLRNAATLAGLPASNYETVSTMALGYEPMTMAVSVRGDLLASAGRVPTIDIWDTKTGARRLQLVGHRLPPVSALLFSPDATLLVSGGGAPEAGTPEPSIRMWNIATGRLLQSIQHAHTAEIVALALSRDGSRLFSAGTDSLKLWELSAVNGASGMWIDHVAQICGLAVSENWQFVVTGGSDQRILVRSVSAMSRFETLYGHSASPCGLRFKEDDGLLASWDFSSTISTIRIWDLKRLAPIHRVDVNGRIFTVFFDGSRIMAVIAGTPITIGSAPSRAAPGSINLLSVEDRQVVGSLPANPKLVAATADGGTLVAAGWDGMVRVFRRRR